MKKEKEKSNLQQKHTTAFHNAHRFFVVFVKLCQTREVPDYRISHLGGATCTSLTAIIPQTTHFQQHTPEHQNLHFMVICDSIRAGSC